MKTLKGVFKTVNKFECNDEILTVIPIELIINKIELERECFVNVRVNSSNSLVITSICYLSDLNFQ